MGSQYTLPCATKAMRLLQNWMATIAVELRRELTTTIVVCPTTTLKEQITSVRDETDTSVEILEIRKEDSNISLTTNYSKHDSNTSNDYSGNSLN